MPSLYEKLGKYLSGVEPARFDRDNKFYLSEKFLLERAILSSGAPNE